MIDSCILSFLCRIGAVFSVAMQAGSGLGLAITNAVSDAVINKTGSHMKGYQVGLWIGFAVTLLCVMITLAFVPSKATLEKKKLLRAEAAQGKVALDSNEAEQGIPTADADEADHAAATNSLTVNEKQKENKKDIVSVSSFSSSG